MSPPMKSSSIPDIPAAVLRGADAEAGPVETSRSLKRTYSFTNSSHTVDRKTGQRKMEVRAWSYVADFPRFALEYFYSEASGTLYSQVDFGMDCGGPPGRVHGGAIGTVFDIALAQVGISSFRRVIHTLSLEVNYKAATPIGSRCWIRAWMSKKEGRRCTITGELMHGGTVCAQSEAVFLATKFDGDEASLDEEHARQERIFEEASTWSYDDELPERIGQDGVWGLPWPEEDPEYLAILNRKGLEFAPEIAPWVGAKCDEEHWDCMAQNGCKVPCRIYWSPETREMVGAFWFSPYAEGPEAGAHGGSIFTAFDHITGTAARYLGTWGCVTKSLVVRYKKFTPLNRVATLEVTGFERTQNGRRNVIKVDLSVDGVLCAQAEAVYIRTMPQDYSHAQAWLEFGPDVPKEVALRNYSRAFEGSAFGSRIAKL